MPCDEKCLLCREQDAALDGLCNMCRVSMPVDVEDEFPVSDYELAAALMGGGEHVDLAA